MYHVNTALSIGADEKTAIADSDYASIPLMPKVTIPDLIGRRVDPSVPKAERLTYEELAERSGGRISATHINDLRLGKKSPRKLTVEKLIGLAKALGDSRLVVFEAATGELGAELKDATVAQVLADFSEIPARDRGDAEFAFRLLKEKVEQAKARRRSHRNP